ncbi:hypothetical protein QQ045_013868 [Rhodiola kirilowii]
MQVREVRENKVTSVDNKAGQTDGFKLYSSKSALKRARQKERRNSGEAESSNSVEDVDGLKAVRKKEVQSKKLGKLRREGVFLYASNLQSERAALWRLIEKEMDVFTNPWMCIGDFNSVLRGDDKRNGLRVRDRDTIELKEFVQNTKLVDMDSSGYFYTLNNNKANPNERIWCKLDRTMGNLAWFDVFRDCLAVFQPPGPVVVSCGFKPRL